MTTLPSEAEMFLERLRAALYPLNAPDREEIVLQYRCHLEDVAAQGHLQLLLCLEHFGSPAQLAKELLDALASGRTMARSGARSVAVTENGLREAQLPSRGIRLAFTVLQRDFAATVAFSAHEIFTARLALASCLTAVTFVDYVLAKNQMVATGHALHYVTFALVATAALVIAYRALLSDSAEMWSLDSDTFRFAAAMAIIFAVPPALMMAGLRLADAIPYAIAICLTGALLAAGFYAVTRAQPYVVALLLGSGQRLHTVWARMRIRVFALATGYGVILVPFYAIHAALAGVAASRTSDQIMRFGLGIAALDALAQTALVISFGVLNAMAYRWVVGAPVPLGWEAFDRDYRPDGNSSSKWRAA